MRSDENLYINADQQKRKLLMNFTSVKSLYGMIHHLRSKGLSDKVAADFYQLILDHTVGRDATGCIKDSLIDKNAFEYIFKKCDGLFTYLGPDEKEKILSELHRLQNINK